MWKGMLSIIFEHKKLKINFLPHIFYAVSNSFYKLPVMFSLFYLVIHRK